MYIYSYAPNYLVFTGRYISGQAIELLDKIEVGKYRDETKPAEDCELWHNLAFNEPQGEDVFVLMDPTKNPSQDVLRLCFAT